MEYVAKTADGSTIRYVDGKRYLWFAPFIWTFVSLIAVALYFFYNQKLCFE